MRANRPSFTAAFVAACRGLDGLLPPGQRLVHDPFGTRFAGPPAVLLERAVVRAPGLFRGVAPALRLLSADVQWLQLRTRALDDIVRAFVADGGRQLVLLGAGFDCRAARLADELHGARVYEVDHPATQARKRAVLAAAGAGGATERVRYLAWDFERDDLAGLPARLAALGHAAGERTLTIWEGVTMYLTPGAIEASVAAVRAYSAPRSQFAITYFDRARIDRPGARARLAARVVSVVGEPFRFGWRPEELPGWLAARGFALVSDRDDATLGGEYFGAHVRSVRRDGRRVALALREG